MVRTSVQDPETQALLLRIEQEKRILVNRIPNVRTVLVVLSSDGMVYDVESLRQKVHLAYPEAAVFFLATHGEPIGVSAPGKVDLLIDLTGPGQRQALFFARKLRRMAKFAVGRNAGLFRKGSYDRVFDEKSSATEIPKDTLARERVVQREVLTLAGVPFAPQGDALPDLGKSIALELPPMRSI